MPINPYAPDYDALRLTVIGSRDVGVDVTPSPLQENPGGATLWLQLHLDELAIALTPTEAQALATRLNSVIDKETRERFKARLPDAAPRGRRRQTGHPASPRRARG